MAITAILIFFYTFFAGQQVDEMRRANDQGWNTVVLTNILGKKTVREMQGQTEAMDKAADAAKTQAVATIEATKATKKAIELTESADIEGDHFECSPNVPLLNRDSSVTLILKNWGKTRAEQVELSYFLGVPSNKTIPETREKPKPIAIAPGGVIATDPVLVGDNVTKFGWSEISAGRVQLHSWGHISYKDVFGHHHCYVWDSIHTPNTKCTFGLTGINDIGECPKDDAH